LLEEVSLQSVCMGSNGRERYDADALIGGGRSAERGDGTPIAVAVSRCHGVEAVYVPQVNVSSATEVCQESLGLLSEGDHCAELVRNAVFAFVPDLPRRPGEPGCRRVNADADARRR